MSEPLTPEQIESQLEQLNGWTLGDEGKRIRKDWDVSNFMSGLEFFGKVADLAEEMNHHPDLHLENYKQAWIEIWTHTADGLTRNDFELARAIDKLD